jgi:hypothetical protein
MRIRSRGVCTAIAAAVLVTVTAGCGSSGGSTGSGDAPRPRTPAHLEILAPAPNAVTGPDTTVRLSLTGARLVPGTQVGGAIRPRRGHIHVSVDGQVVAMVNRLSVPLQALAPGRHVVSAEFVASDHAPFANRVVAATTFRVA